MALPDLFEAPFFCPNFRPIKYQYYDEKEILGNQLLGDECNLGLWQQRSNEHKRF